MKTSFNIHKISLLSVIFLQSCIFELDGQILDSVRIYEISCSASDDSLRMKFILTVSNLRLGRRESLTLYPRITDGKSGVALPAVVYTGRLRQKYDARRRAFSKELQTSTYQTYTVKGKGDDRPLEYAWSAPYSSRFQNGKLTVEYFYDDCCRTVRLGEESRPLPAVHYPERERDTVILTETARKPSMEKLYLEYPVGESQIFPLHGNNGAELSKLDGLLEERRDRRMRITAYASPEGHYADNERLARSRADGFLRWLLEHHGIPETKVTATHVAEDWEGLRKLVLDSSLELRRGAAAIIDGSASSAERKARLMQLGGGDFWRQLEPYFKMLRRIEVEIIEN